jgi:hypothetical protein
MKYRVLKVVAAACLTLAGAPVWAAASSSATLGNVSITLIDLDTADGIAPSISFLPGPQGYAGPLISGAAHSFSPGEEFNNFERAGTRAGASLSDGAHTALASSAASVTGAGTGTGIGIGFGAMSANGAALSATDGYGRYESFATVPAAVTGQGFVLSANTMVRFSITGNAQAAYTLGYHAQSAEGEYASGLLTLLVSGAAADGSGDLIDAQRESAVVRSMIGHSAPGPDSASWSGLLTASYSNLAAHSSLGNFYAEASAAGFSVSAVPEPETAAMLLAGLGLVGAVARRRRAV